MAGFLLRAEASFGAAAEDEEAAALGGTLVETVVVFAEEDVEHVEDEVAGAGPSAALGPEGTAGFCKEVHKCEILLCLYLNMYPASCLNFHCLSGLSHSHPRFFPPSSSSVPQSVTGKPAAQADVNLTDNEVEMFTISMNTGVWIRAGINQGKKGVTLQTVPK